MTDDIKKGDIYYASLNPIIGSEQSGNRPVVIVQNNIGNKYSPTVLIAPITSKVNSKPNLPTHVIIKKNGKITHDSIILIEQIRVIDKQRLQEYLCKIEPEKIDEINKAMIEAFDITNKYKWKGTDMLKKRKDFIVSVICNGGVDDIQVKASNRKEAMQMVEDVLLKCDIFGFKSSDEFDLKVRKIRKRRYI